MVTRFQPALHPAQHIGVHPVGQIAMRREDGAGKIALIVAGMAHEQAACRLDRPSSAVLPAITEASIAGGVLDDDLDAIAFGRRVQSQIMQPVGAAVLGAMVSSAAMPIRVWRTWSKSAG